jgi:sigma-B regulation protein RsbU (phosphoserine phosphatase)
MLLCLLFFVACSLWLLAQWRRETVRSQGVAELLSRMEEEKLVVFKMLEDLGGSFSDTSTPEDLAQIALKCSINITGGMAGAVFEMDSRDGTLRAISVSGLFPPLTSLPKSVETKLVSRAGHLEDFLRTEPLSASHVLIAEAFESAGMLLESAVGDERLPQFDDPSLKWESMVAVPINYREDNYGILILANKPGGFNRTDLGVLRSIAALAAFSLHNARVQHQLAEKHRLDHDLEVAREIQRVLLPDQCPELRGWDVAAVNLPARDVSGDYYDFIPLENGCWGVAIADVSGKGIPASLVMTMCRTVLRMRAKESPSAARVLREVNRLLYPDIREDMFITMLFAILDPARRTLSLARAGHEAPFLCHEGKIQPLRSAGMALGIDSGEVFDTVITDLSVTLAPGDSIVFYTDGVTEAIGASGEEFGKENFCHAIQQFTPEGASAIVRNVVERLDRFRAGAEKYDDVTLISLYVQP